MFKNGQVVRSIKNGFVFIVYRDEVTGPYVRVKALGGEYDGEYGAVARSDIELIGNNYRSKK